MKVVFGGADEAPKFFVGTKGIAVLTKGALGGLIWLISASTGALVAIRFAVRASGATIVLVFGAEECHGSFRDMSRLELIPDIEMEDAGIDRGDKSAMADLGVVFEAEGPVLSSVWAMENAVEMCDPHLMLFGNVGLD
jgi:hypothetical protein